MEENNNNNPPRVSRSKDGPTISTTTRSSRTTRFAAVDDGGGGDLIECSGKHCRSCIAGLIADCVALCCCPCAVLHCFALAFVKAPWVVGRRCLGKKKNKEKGSQKLKRKKCKCCKRGHEEYHDVDDVGVDVVLERNKEGDLSGEVDSVTINAGFEAEKVWLELCQIGHLDFGRVSSSHHQFTQVSQ